MEEERRAAETLFLWLLCGGVVSSLETLGVQVIGAGVLLAGMPLATESKECQLEWSELYQWQSGPSALL